MTRASGAMHMNHAHEACACSQKWFLVQGRGEREPTAAFSGQPEPVASSHFAVGMENSGPLGVLSGQRCMMDFCRV